MTFHFPCLVLVYYLFYSMIFLVQPSPSNLMMIEIMTLRLCLYLSKYHILFSHLLRAHYDLQSFRNAFYLATSSLEIPLWRTSLDWDMVMIHYFGTLGLYLALVFIARSEFWWGLTSHGYIHYSNNELLGQNISRLSNCVLAFMILKN